jgi:putative DNA primase/helicase
LASIERQTGVKLKKWFDADGKPHRWAVPAELLAGDGLDVRRELMRCGLEISPNRAARDLLCMYLQSWQVEGRARPHLPGQNRKG